MRNSRRNIPDPVSPQNPVIKKDINHGENRTQDHLQDNTSIEEIYSDVNGDRAKEQGKLNQSEDHSSNLSTENNGI